MPRLIPWSRAAATGAPPVDGQRPVGNPVSRHSIISVVISTDYRHAPTAQVLTDSPDMTIIMVSMPPERPFVLVYDPEVKEHLRAIESRFYGLIRATIEDQLSLEPETETRNRKPLKRPVLLEAEWELRLGPDNRFRVFYTVEHGRREVHILAIGVKLGNRLTIGRQEVEV